MYDARSRGIIPFMDNFREPLKPSQRLLDEIADERRKIVEKRIADAMHEVVDRGLSGTGITQVAAKVVPMPADEEEQTAMIADAIRRARDAWCAKTGEWDGTKMPVDDLAVALVEFSRGASA
jgi:hypothetical protein